MKKITEIEIPEPLTLDPRRVFWTPGGSQKLKEAPRSSPTRHPNETRTIKNQEKFQIPEPLTLDPRRVFWTREAPRSSRRPTEALSGTQTKQKHKKTKKNEENYRN